MAPLRFFSKMSGQMHSAKGNVKESVRIKYLSFLPRSEDDVTLFTVGLYDRL